VDPERTTRIAAAQGLGDAGRPDATALLRYKILVGDDEPQVLAACIESLLSLAREPSIDFVTKLLTDEDGDRAEVAALALGGARIAEPLAAWCRGCLPEQRQRIGYLALALLRDDRANALLLDAIRTRVKADAVAAARALADQLRAAAKPQQDKAARREIDALLA